MHSDSVHADAERAPPDPGPLETGYTAGNLLHAILHCFSVPILRGLHLLERESHEGTARLVPEGPPRSPGRTVLLLRQPHQGLQTANATVLQEQQHPQLLLECTKFPD